MACCIRIYKLGCYSHCTLLPLPVLPETSGVYTLIYTFAGITTAINVDVVAGEPILLDFSILNEEASYTLTIITDTGAVLTKTVEGTVYDCFAFKTGAYKATSLTVAPSGGDFNNDFNNDFLI